MSRTPARAGRVRRGLLAVVLAAVPAWWAAGERGATQAAPAELISRDSGGAPLASWDFSPSVSGDGSIVAFTADGTPFSSVFDNDWVYVRDRNAGTTVAVPQPHPPPSFFPVDRMTGGVISRDGCHVAFWGFQQLLFLPGTWRIYVWNRCPGGGLPIAVSDGFPSLPLATQLGDLAISADGRYVAFIVRPPSAPAPSVGRIDAGTTPATFGTVSVPTMTSAFTIDISDNGLFVAFGAQLSNGSDTRVLGWTPPCIAGTTLVCNVQVLSVTSNGAPATGFNYNPSLSADGRYVAFVSNGPEFLGLPGFTSLQVYVRDRAAGVTKLVTDTPGTPMAGEVDEPEITPDGTQIALEQGQPPVVEFAFGTTDVTQVLVARTTAGFFDDAVFDLVSFGVSGAPTSSLSVDPSISSNGRFVAFSSSANNELSGTAMPAGREVWMRQRPVALDITPTIDFGTVDVGGQSAPRDAVVQNTSGVVINISAVTPPAAPFFVTGNTCGGSLPPGLTCRITMVFRPTAGGGASSSVSVSGDGLSVSSSLRGVGRAPNVPTPGSLTINPTAADYGSAAVGSSVAARDFVVSNPGETAVTFAGVGLSGGGADQFAIDSNSCTGSLAGGASCTVRVSATITREGAMSATLGILGTGGQSAQATLRVTGTVQLFTPVLKMNPGVVKPGQVTVAIGTGFPPNIDVQLAFNGELPFVTVPTDGTGALRFDLLVLRNGVRIGGREVIAIDQPQFTGVRAPLLIDLATYRPAGTSNPAITNGLRSLFIRGG